MYIRTKKVNKTQRTVVQLAESFRDNGKTKQRIIRHVGTAHSEEELEALLKIAESIKIQLEHEDLKKDVNLTRASYASKIGKIKKSNEDVLIPITHLQEQARHILGIHDIYGVVYKQIGFTNPFSRPHQRETASNLLREIVLARIANPQSKRASVAQLQEQFGVSLNLDRIYQMMDKIDDEFCQRIQKQALKSALQLTKDKLRVLFYDATTLYFESFTEDELKQNGYSKDMKFNQSQVLLALFVTEKGLPVGYELFPGATFEGHTLVMVLNKLKARYDIDDVVVVADRGMLSADNLAYLEKHHFRYIVGAKLKSLNVEDQEKVLDFAKRLPKDKVTKEYTHRISTSALAPCVIKVLESRPEESQYCRYRAYTYVLYRIETQWHLACYEKGRHCEDITLSQFPELTSQLSRLSGKKVQKWSKDERLGIQKILSDYHHKPQTLLLSYRAKRAFKDQADRIKAIQKLEKRLKKSKNPKQLISKYGFQKFVKVEGEARLEIDDDKLKDEAQWDGIAGVYTNSPELSDDMIWAHYRGLWQVEESFRINKHDLRIRPVYHWTPQRIKAHIAIAFMAFVCVRYLEYRISVQTKRLSPRAIREALMQVQASIIQDTQTGKTYLLPSSISPEAKEIYRVLGIKMATTVQALKM